jgi:hypothetical protein
MTKDKKTRASSQKIIRKGGVSVKNATLSVGGDIVGGNKVTVNQESSMSSVSAQDGIQSLRRQLRQHVANLNKLKEDAAIYGAGEIPLRLQNQIEAEQLAIKKLEAKILALKT